MKAIVLVLFFLIFVSFFPLIFLGKTFFFADNFMLMVPGKMFTTESLKHGTIPLWNPHILAGVPFLADISQSLVYPSTLLFTIFQPSSALTISILAHLFWGSLGMAMLSYLLWKNRYHSLLAAATWMLSPILLASVNNLAVTQSVSWLPWMMYFALRICKKEHMQLSQIFLIFCMSLSFLGGHPYPLLYGGIFMGLFILAYPLSLIEKLQRFFIVMLLWITLSAVVLFPFLEAIGLSTRAHMSTAETTSGVLQPAHALALIIPNIFSDQSNGILWGPDWGKMKGIPGYVSIVGICSLLCLLWHWSSLQRYHKLLLCVGSIGLLYTFGFFLPVMSVLYSIVPGFRFLRSPGEAGILWVLCSSLLLGIALEKSSAFFRTHARFLLSIMGIIIFLVSVGWVVQRTYFHAAWSSIDGILSHKLSQSTFHTEEKDKVIVNHVLIQFGIACAMLFCAIFSISKKSKLGLLGVIVLDLWIASIPSLFVAPSSIFTQHSAQAEVLQSKDTQQYRFLSLSGYFPWTGLPTYWDNMISRPPFTDSRFIGEEQHTFKQLQARRDNLAMDWGMPYKLSTPMGYGAFVLQRSADYWETTNNGASVNELDVVPLDDERLNQQGVKYILVDKYVMSLESILKQYPKLKTVKDADLYAVLENPDAQPMIRSEYGSIRDINIQVNSISFAVNMQKDGDVMLAESWYPGWRCSYEGGACKVEWVSGGMKVMLPEGQWNVQLDFQYKHMNIYAFMSGATLLWLCIWGGILAVKRGKLSHNRVK